jgi:translation initiation factor 4G
LRVEIREAQREDAAFLAWLILTAGRAHVHRGIWDVILDRTDEEHLSFLRLLAVTRVPHLFHYSCYLLAEVNGKPAAGLGGYDPRSHGYAALRRALPEVFQGLGVVGQAPQPSERAARVIACIPDELEEAWVIDSVATLPEFRRRGIVDMLLEAILDKGRRHGFPRAQINMYIGNIPAQRAYEKKGFQILDEKRSADFEQEIGSPGMARLVRDLRSPTPPTDTLTP